MACGGRLEVARVQEENEEGVGMEGDRATQMREAPTPRARDEKAA